MHEFYKTQYSCLKVESVLGYEKNNKLRPLFTFEFAGTNNSKAKMFELKKGQYDWQASLKFSLSPTEVIQTRNFIRKFMKDGKLCTKRPADKPFPVDPQKYRLPISHKRKNGDRVTIILSFQNKLVDWERDTNPYNRLELWFNAAMKDSNKTIKQVMGKDQEGNKRLRDQKFSMMLETNELELFFHYVDAYASMGLLMHDVSRLIKDRLKFNGDNNNSNNNNRVTPANEITLDDFDVPPVDNVQQKTVKKKKTPNVEEVEIDGLSDIEFDEFDGDFDLM